jgi:hypothetical protein
MSSKIPEPNFKPSRGLKFSLGLIAISGLTYAVNKYLINNNPHLIRKIYFDKFFNFNKENRSESKTMTLSTSQYVKIIFIYT